MVPRKAMTPASKECWDTATFSRNFELVRCVLNGSSYLDIAEKHSITPARARQIMQSTLRQAISLNLGPIDYRLRTNGKLKDLRVNKDYWLDKVDRLAKYWDN